MAGMSPKPDGDWERKGIELRVKWNLLNGAFSYVKDANLGFWEVIRRLD